MVRWKGFSAEWDTWEPVDNLSSCSQKVKTFESLQKQKSAATQKYAQKLVNRSKMTQQNTDKKTVVKLTGKKRQKKEDKNVSKQNGGNTSLEDVFKSVIGASSTKVVSPSQKRAGLLPKKRSSDSSPGISPGAKKAKLSLNNDKTNKPNLAGGKASHKKTPAKNSVTKSKSSLTVKDIVVKSAVKHVNKKGSPKKTISLKGESPGQKKEKVSEKKSSPSKKLNNKEKNWEKIDAEISFSSDEDISSGTPVSKVVKLSSVKKDNQTSEKGSAKVSKLSSPTKKKQMLNLSVMQLIGKKSSKGLSNLMSMKLDGSFQDATSGNKVKHSDKVKQGGTKVKSAKKTKTTEKRKKSNNDTGTIDLDSDSDSDILYSLNDTSLFEISDSSDNNDHVTKSSTQERSQSESGVEKLVKGSQGVKLAKKSKSVSSGEKSTSGETPRKSSGNGKTIRLLDSLKKSSPIKPGMFQGS